MDASPSQPAAATPAPSVRLTPSGGIALAGSLGTVLAGALLLSGPVFATGVLALVLLAASRCAARRHLLGTTVRRVLPPRGHSGESFPVQTNIVPGPFFPAGTTLAFRDPLAPATGGKRIAPTGAGIPVTLRYTGKSAQRGRHRPRFWKLRSTWPLGLFATDLSGPFRDSATLLLRPGPLLPESLLDHLQQLAREAIVNAPEPPDPTADFRLLREFRSGDAVKRIHWPASLRSGRLQVAESEPPHPKPRRYGLFLHSYEPAGQILTPETFETILRIAAGLLLRFQREEISVLFLHHPGRPVSLTHRGDTARILDHLATCRRHPFRALAPLAAAGRAFRHCDEIFLLSDCPRHEWEKVLRPAFPSPTCIDATSLSGHSRGEIKKRVRLPA